MAQELNGEAANGESFERFLREAGEEAKGDEILKLFLQSWRLVRDLVGKRVAEVATLMETEERVVNVEMLYMPESLKNRIIQEENGKDVVLVMSKKIGKTDLNKNDNRLLIPWGNLRDYSFLNQEEKSILDSKNGAKKGIEVSVIPPSLESNVKLKLKKWKTGYCLTEKWHSLVVNNQENGLEIGVTVNLWSFRNNSSELCFALQKC